MGLPSLLPERDYGWRAVGNVLHMVQVASYLGARGFSMLGTSGGRCDVVKGKAGYGVTRVYCVTRTYSARCVSGLMCMGREPC